MKIHATFAPDATPESMAAAFSQIADDLLAKPPENLEPGALEELVQTLRGEAQQISGNK